MSDRTPAAGDENRSAPVRATDDRGEPARSIGDGGEPARAIGDGSEPGRAITDGGEPGRATTDSAGTGSVDATGLDRWLDGNWQRIARREGSLLLDSTAAQYLNALLVGAVLLAAYIYPVSGSEPYTTAHFSGYVVRFLRTLVPLVGVLVGYSAVASDRESGVLLLSLSLPVSRRDVVLGAFAGRFAVVATALLAALVGAGALVVYPYGELAALPYLAFVLATLAFVAIWIGIGVAASTSVATKQRALALGVGLFFLFVLVWDALPSVVEVALNELGLLQGQLPEPVLFVSDLAPGNAFERVLAGFVDPGESADGPWYRSRWVALGTFAAWTVVPLALALHRFERSDLT